MSQKPPASPGEQPRSDPEIIPPSRDREDVLWTAAGRRADYRIYSAQLGPFTLALLLLLGIAFLVALLAILVIGTFLLWIPIIALLVIAVIVSAWWRRLLRREG